jgi:cell division septation protein DedD
MDSAMRDLEQLRERADGGDGTGRRLALLALAAATTMGLVLALCLQVGTGTADDAESEADPLARLDRASGLAPDAPRVGPAPEVSADTDVDTVALTFPESLQGSDRPEVAAALAAASAELRHPDPIARSARSGSGLPTIAAPIVPISSASITERLPTALPAALAAGTGGAIARAAPHDPMLLDALPEERIGESAPEGHDGDYTVQVISYDSPEGAHAFAAGLRARGHRSFVMRADVEGRGTVYRVRIGPFHTQAEAATYRRQFEETERMSTIVVRRR